MAFNAQAAGVNLESPAVIQLLKIYDQMGQKLFFRSLEKYEKLIQPWQLDEEGFIRLLDWHGFQQSELSQEDEDSWGPMGGGHGAYLVK